MNDLLIKCDNCEGTTEWSECNKHRETDFSCYQIICLGCQWSQADCDTTEHCEIVNEREGE